MNELQTLQTFQALKRAGFEGAYRKTSFLCHRKLRDGSEQEVTVELLDRGEDSQPNLRYLCIAKAKNGKAVQGNSSESIAGALVIQLHKLDD